MDPVVGIVVRHVYEGETLQLDVSLSETMYSVKIEIQKHLQSKPEPNFQKLIFCGKVCHDKERLADILSKMDLSNPQTFHLILSNPESRERQRPTTNTHVAPRHDTTSTVTPAAAPQREQVPVPQAQTQAQAAQAQYTFDNESMEVAHALFMSDTFAYLPFDTQRTLLDMFQYGDYSYTADTTGATARGPEIGAAGNNARAENLAAQAQEQRPLFWWFDISLIARLAFGVFVFSRGSSTMLTRMIIAAVLYYVFAMQIVQALISRFMPRSQNNPNAGTDDSRTQQQQQQQDRGIISTMVDFGKGIIPRTPGIFMDFVCLIASFSLSLYPSWNPSANA